MSFNGAFFPPRQESGNSTSSNASSKDSMKKAKVHTQKKPAKFLFVDEAKNGTVGTRRNDTRKRRFVMQRARQEKYWSTTTSGIDNRSRDLVKRHSTGTVESESSTPTSSTPSQASLSPVFRSPVKPQYVNNCSNCQLAQPSGAEQCVSCITSNAAKPSRPRDTFTARKFDPFEVLPVEMDKRSSAFINHWLSVSTKGGVAMDVRQKITVTRDEMFNLAVTSKALMHSILSSAAVDTYMRGGRSTIADITLYTTRAIGEVNKELTNPESSTADATIAAVFVLLVLGEFRILPRLSSSSGQSLDASVEQSIHMIGFKKMIELRGGLHALKHSNRILQALILWYVTARAAASFDKPCLDVHQVALEYSRKNNPAKAYPQAFYTILNIQESLSISESLADIMLDLGIYVPKVSAYLKRFDADEVSLMNEGCLIHCRLLSWLHTPGLRRSSVEDSIAIACLISNDATYSPGVRKFDVMRHVGVARLAATLKATSGAEWSISPLLLLWILATGGIRGDGRPERDWFVAQARELCFRLQIRRIEHLIEILQTFLWLDLGSKRGVAKFWNEILYPESEDSDTNPDEALFAGFQLYAHTVMPYMAASGLSTSSADLSEVQLPPAVWTYRQTTELAVISNANWKRAEVADVVENPFTR